MKQGLFAKSSFGLTFQFLAFGLLLTSVLPGRAAQIFDISSDFSKSNNPAGVWTLGWKSNLTSSLVVLPVRGTVGADNGVPIDYWQAVPLNEPTVYHNGTTNTATSNGGSGVHPPGATWYFAGPNVPTNNLHNPPTNNLHNPPNGSDRKFGVIRFTAPGDATFELQTAVGPYLSGSLQGDTDFHVLHNAVELFGMNLASGASATFSAVLNLSAGDTVDFAIGRGADDNNYASGLQITATLTEGGTNNPPTIFAQPSSQTALEGSTVNFSVAAFGTPPLSYQWRLNDADISAATNSTLTLQNVQLANAGNYSVVVANDFGSVTSAAAVLTVRGLVFDISSDFSRTDNPAGVWTLGWKSNLTSSLVVMPVRGTVGADNGVPIDYWQAVPSDEPTVYHNGTTNTATSNGTNGMHAPGAVWYFAGPNGSGRDFGVIRFTAPSDASFELQTAVGPYLSGPVQGDTDFHVLLNSKEIFGTNLASGATAAFSEVLTLNGGDTVDFAVGRGQDDDNYASGLTITATLAPGETTDAPIIFTPPSSQTALLGSTATFSVTVFGTPPFSYQWRFNDADISGATDSALTLQNVQLANAGNYSVVVTNDFGSVTSAVAVLTVSLPPPTVRVVSVNAAGGGQADVPVQLLAQGSENAVGFSLNFNTALLALESVTLGEQAPAGATLIVNDTQAGNGRVGLGVALAAGSVFSAGTREIVVVRFTAAAPTTSTVASITFGDVPTARQLSDAQAFRLTAVFESGTVSIGAVDFEGDVATRPDGDRALSIIDWVQLGRFVAALDTVSAGEFQRADCAPRVTRGNGTISVTDYVQAGRYAVGLDPLTPVGGPTSEGELAGRGGDFQPASGGRALRLLNTTIAQGQTNFVPAVLEATGNENALAFSVSFDPLKLGYVGAVNGAGAAGASVTVNASQKSAGHLGIVFAMPPGSSLAAGSHELVLVQFVALAPVSSTATVSFDDAPVVRETSDPQANALTTIYTSGTISVTPPAGPPLRVIHSGGNLFISWPSSATGFQLEATAGALGTPWSLVPGVVDLGEQKLAIVSVTGPERYFRLKKQ